jgi:biopolymer transport protein ExbD
MRINLGEDEQPEIGLIALIDCIFFLLMFFMVATSFNQQTDLQPQSDLSIVLPEANASLGNKPSPTHIIAVTVDKKGNVLLDGAAVSIKKFQDHIREHNNNHKQIMIEISGDEAVPYKYIVSLIDICQFEGITNISLQTRGK